MYELYDLFSHIRLTCQPRVCPTEVFKNTNIDKCDSYIYRWNSYEMIHVTHMTTVL